jgi:nucleoid DNA-binding protein
MWKSSRIHLASRQSRVIQKIMRRTTKQHLVIDISNATGMTHAEVTRVVDGFMDALSNHLASGKEVALREFGTFSLPVSRRSLGRDPKRPEIPVHFSPQRVVRFRPGQELKEAVAKLPIAEDA